MRGSDRDFVTVGKYARTTRSDESPFTMPPLECRNCGRSARHVYCWHWLERLRLFLGGDPSA